jgi:acetamidase/formamidase
VPPGSRLRIETELNIGDVLHSVDEPFDPSMIRLPYANGATGPVAIEGATPEHVVICDIEEMELVPPGFTALMPGFGPFVDWIRRRDFGVHARVVDVVDGEVGELCGIGAIEIRTRTTVRLDLAPRPSRMTWPRIETEEHIGVVACARPLEDAFRLAVEGLVNWLEDDYDFEPHDAVLLLGQVAEARCTQLANPKYTYVAKIAKQYLGR